METRDVIRAVFATGMAGTVEGVIGGVVAKVFTDHDFLTGFLFAGSGGAIGYWVWAYVAHKLTQERE